VPIPTAGAAIQLQGSSDGVTRVTLTSISSNLSAGQFQQHRVAVAGNGTGPIYVGQAQFGVDSTGANEV
jgi:hypothetical protein